MHMSSLSEPQRLECQSLQKEECDVLEAIYPECISQSSNRSIKLEIPIELASNTDLSIETDGTVPQSPDGVNTSSAQVNISLSALPPLLLQIILPPGYPLNYPPSILSIRTTHSWFGNISRLRETLLHMWQGEGVLYNWLEYIRSGEFLILLEPSDSGCIRILHPAPWILAPLLLAHEASTKSSQFSQNSYQCTVCLESYKGSKCLQLSCSHIFCRACLESFWTLCITEGDVGRVGCPDPECVKSARDASEEEVARVVTEDDLRRWRWLREKRAIERDPSIIHCPLAFCQSPVPKPLIEEGEDSGWDRLRTCEACSYSFCSFCKRTWHGPISSCPISVTETLVIEYMALPSDSPARAVIERRFGRANVLRLVAIYEEEQLNKKWIADSTMACPQCGINVEKSMGCNHMTCTKCSQHFCYRCGARLNPNNPYIHFSTLGHRCYNKLFDFQSVDDEWQPVEGFDAL